MGDSETETETDTDTDTEEEQNLKRKTKQSISLGQMIPIHQRNITVQTNYIRSYPVVIHSRDRNLKREHLFAFRLLFGTTCQHCRYSTCDSRYVGGSMQNNNSEERRCAVEQAFSEVQSLQLVDMLLPHASFLQSITNPLDQTKTIPLSIPAQVLIQLTPHNGKPLLLSLIHI